MARWPSIEERLWSRLEQEPGGCWVWPGGKALGGYGVIWFRGRSEGAHRVAYILTHGEVPPGMFVLHSCDNPPCCNPAHLFLGTHSENMHDMDRKGRRVVRGLRFGVEHHSARLTPDTVRAIRASLDEGVTARALAREYGVASGTIDKIKHRLSWANV